MTTRRADAELLPVCLTIAGSDSGGGAGIQADIKSMHANGVFATTVITAITAQNTVQVSEAADVPLPIIQAQLNAVYTDFDIAAVKTGMLSSSEVIDLIASSVEEFDLHPLVVDPVMISKSGFALLAPEAIDTLAERLIPLADIVTPNVHEAALLSGAQIRGLSDAKEAARRIHSMGPRYVLVKGGHLSSDEDATDVLFDGTAFFEYRKPRIDTIHTHGTGCTYASAIAANLAKGAEMPEAIKAAKNYVTEAIRHGLPLGKGKGPTDHFFFLRD